MKVLCSSGLCSWVTTGTYRKMCIESVSGKETHCYHQIKNNFKRLQSFNYCASFSASHYNLSMWQSSLSLDGLVTWVRSFTPWQGWEPWPRNGYLYFCQAAISSCTQGHDSAGACADLLSGVDQVASLSYVQERETNKWFVQCASIWSVTVNPPGPPGEHWTLTS